MKNPQTRLLRLTRGVRNLGREVYEEIQGEFFKGDETFVLISRLEGALEALRRVKHSAKHFKSKRRRRPRRKNGAANPELTTIDGYCERKDEDDQTDNERRTDDDRESNRDESDDVLSDFGE